MRCQFTLRDWRQRTGHRRFSLAAWKALSGLKRFTLPAWCDFLEQGEPEPEPSYEGPLDLVPGAIPALIGAYGMRALSTAMLGQPLFRLAKMDGGAQPEQTFSADAATGDAPVAAITSFLGADDGAAVFWYDQSANENHMDGDSEFEWLWSANVQGGRPAFTAEIAAQLLTGINISFPSGQTTIFFVGRRIELVEASGFSFLHVRTGSPIPADVALSHGGNVAGGEVDPVDAIVLFDAAVEFGNKNIRINGATQPITADFDNGGAVGAFTFRFEFNAEDEPAYALEVLLFNTLLSDADRALIRQNIATYYGITLP